MHGIKALPVRQNAGVVERELGRITAVLCIGSLELRVYKGIVGHNLRIEKYILLRSIYFQDI